MERGLSECGDNAYMGASPSGSNRIGLPTRPDAPRAFAGMQHILHFHGSHAGIRLETERRLRM
ncbi:hypothetical protein BZU93_29580 [Salmonella enterica subsp. enterica]|nr:hypothetical protein [Salmonella enterica subsp. enterica serovar Enteritidis]